VTTSEPPLVPPLPPEESEPEPDAAPERERASDVLGLVALAYGWKQFREHLGPMLVVVLIPFGAQIVLALAERALIDSVARWFLLQVVGIVVSSVAGLGLVRMALLVSAGESPTAGEAFRYDRWGAWIAFSLVFGLVEGVGLVLCVFPGLLFLAYFGLAPYFFVDRGMSMLESLRASRDAVVRGGLAFPVLLTIVVGALGLILAGVGVFVTEAVAALGLAYLYRHSAGESVSA
jgi:hypothetical protein